MTNTTAADFDALPTGTSIKLIHRNGGIMYFRKTTDGLWMLTGPYSVHTSEDMAAEDGIAIILS